MNNFINHIRTTFNILNINFNFKKKTINTDKSLGSDFQMKFILVFLWFKYNFGDEMNFTSPRFKISISSI
jgi:hypothetical protein